MKTQAKIRKADLSGSRRKAGARIPAAQPRGRRQERAVQKSADHDRPPGEAGMVFDSHERQAKIAALQQAIEQGSYCIDAAQIARRLLTLMLLKCHRRPSAGGTVNPQERETTPFFLW